MKFGKIRVRGNLGIMIVAAVAGAVAGGGKQQPPALLWCLERQVRGGRAAEADGVGNQRYAWSARADIGGEELRRPETLVSSRSGFPVTAAAGARWSAESAAA
jgi:hypothetical protein